MSTFTCYGRKFVFGTEFNLSPENALEFSGNKKKTRFENHTSEQKKELKEGEEGDKSFQKFLEKVGSCKSLEDVLKPEVTNNSLPSEELSLNSIIHEFFSGGNHSNSQPIPDDRLPSKKRKHVEMLN